MKKEMKKEILEIKEKIFIFIEVVADLAQQVRASDCGPEGHGFDSHSPPHFLFFTKK